MAHMPPDPFGRVSITEQIYGHEVKAYSGNRDAALRQLLGTDYDYAHQSGLINMFYYDPESGQDGLMHVLGGEYFIKPDGTRIPRGFHHEPSAKVAWVYDANGKRIEQPNTYVDRNHVKEGNKQTRRTFAEAPYAPYKARVVIDGVRKMTVDRDPKTGEQIVVETNNGMFPKEYDALAVMQAVRAAAVTRDQTQDELDETGSVIIANGEAPLLDGKTNMNIHLILDAATGKVVSAYPLVKPRAMKLSRDEVKQNLGVGVE